MVDDAVSRPAPVITAAAHLSTGSSSSDQLSCFFFFNHYDCVLVDDSIFFNNSYIATIFTPAPHHTSNCSQLNPRYLPHTILATVEPLTNPSPLHPCCSLRRAILSVVFVAYFPSPLLRLPLLYRLSRSPTLSRPLALPILSSSKSPVASTQHDRLLTDAVLQDVSGCFRGDGPRRCRPVRAAPSHRPLAQ